MTTIVDFYLLEQQPAKNLYGFACKLVVELVPQLIDNQKIFIGFNQLSEIDNFNKLLWTFDDTSFIPHCLVTAEIANNTPIHLGLFSQLQQQSIILNLSHEIFHASPDITRIIEIVPDESLWRQASRKKYSDYKAQQCELKTHKIL